MPQNDRDITAFLYNDGVFQLHLAHRLKCCVQPFPHVLVRRIGKLINKSHYRRVSSKTLNQNVLRSDMTWKRTRASHFYSVVENGDVNIIRRAVVTVEHGVCKNFMYRRNWI